MPPEDKVKGLLLLIFIVVIGLVGLIMVVMLLASWRRSLARGSGRRARKAPTAPVDAWRESGQRLRVEESEDDDQTGGDERDG